MLCTLSENITPMIIISYSHVQINQFSFCFSLYFLNTVSQGLKIVDPAGNNWLYFSYDVDATQYSLGKGFLGNYTLGKFKENRNSSILCVVGIKKNTNLIPCHCTYIHIMTHCDLLW
jgi:hypothetical protein